MRAVIELDLPQPQQSRSLKTQQSFVDAGWEILRTQSWESISITAIAKRAGRSVGVFYQRFGSKDDFLTVLLNRWLETSYSSLSSWPPAQSGAELIDWYLRDAFERIRGNRYLWRAALQRSWDDPVFWEPFRVMAARRRDVLAERLGDLRGRPLDAAEENRLGMAVQVFNSVLNNALLNDPGPLRIDQPEFLPALEEIFMTVAALDL
ncbi:MAG TPA: TetR/AcrR family transcriptional regulator [Sphingobium sp.]|nr:TetR/AcrR family transcriptional regulator [Sphingobium sp.]